MRGHARSWELVGGHLPSDDEAAYFLATGDEVREGEEGFLEDALPNKAESTTRLAHHVRVLLPRVQVALEMVDDLLLECDTSVAPLHPPHLTARPPVGP